MSSQISAPKYPFLSRPPPPKRRLVQPPAASPPTCDLPPTPYRRSSFTTRVAAWASHVQPGTPAPVSPYRSLSLTSRRPSGSARLTAGVGHGRISSSPFIATPTTASHKTFDFTAIGYNTTFVHMLKTPETPSPLLRAKAEKELQLHQERLQLRAEKQEKRGKMIEKIKSLTNLRPRSKSTSRTEVPDVPVPPLPVLSPTRTAPMPVTKSKPKAKSKKSTSKKKKAIYGTLVRAPPSLANELALMQFTDGGKVDDHIKRVMTTESGVGDVHRDGKGGVWRDRDEELEYRRLLMEVESGDEDLSESNDHDKRMSWVKFGTPTSPIDWTTVAAADPLMNVDRRNSASTQSTLDSDLDPAYLMQTDLSPLYHDELVPSFEPLQANAKPGSMLLSLPARPFRAAKHLRKPEFIVDMQAFGLAMQANTATDEILVAKSPRSPLFSTQAFHAPAPSNSPGAVPRRTRARRRPAPLKISPGMQKMRRVIAVSSPGSGIPPLSSRAFNVAYSLQTVVPLLSPRAPLTPMTQTKVVKEAKREFILNSFQPEVSVFEDDSECDFAQKRVPSKARGAESRMKRRASRLDLMSIFGART